MKGASAELCVATSSTPNTSSMTSRGRSHSFFLTLKNRHNSPRNDMPEPVYRNCLVDRLLIDPT
jgi:hypothetical protein